MTEDFFKDKKITLMGLGLLGRGIGDALFLAKKFIPHATTLYHGPVTPLVLH